MAKKATSKTSGGAAGSGGGKAKAGASKPRPKRKTARSAGASKASAAGKKEQQDRKRAQERPSQHNAADAVIKLLESPLVVDLIAVGATAALAAIAEQRFGSRRNEPGHSKSTVKAAGTAAAAAMGRRIASEVEEILKASKEARDDEGS